MHYYVHCLTVCKLVLLIVAASLTASGFKSSTASAKKCNRWSSNVLNHRLEESATMSWVNNWIIRNSFCPWANAEVMAGNMCVVTLTGDSDNLIKNLLEIAVRMTDTTEATGGPVISSALVVIPALKNFAEFLEFFYELEEKLEGDGFATSIQIATFHPNYIFAGAHEDDPANFTNRSPFPILHLLRVEEVRRAIESIDGRTDLIWKRNIEHLQKKGLRCVTDEFKNILSGP